MMESSAFSVLYGRLNLVSAVEKQSAAHKPNETIVNKVGHWRLDRQRSALKLATPFFLR